MGDKTHISWTDATWPVITGCTRVSPGCASCYAVRDSWRMGHNPNPKVGAVYANTVERQPNGQLDWTGNVFIQPQRLDWPLKWKTPRRVFVCNESDLFHPSVPDEFIAAVFGIMAATPWHTYQVLTKRPERMFRWLTEGMTRVWGPGAPDRATPNWCVWQAWARINQQEHNDPKLKTAFRYQLSDKISDDTLRWPLPNVWLLTSAEDQKRLDERWPWLQKTPAVVRGLSLEPLLGPIDLKAITGLRYMVCGTGPHSAGTERAIAEVARLAAQKIGWPFLHWVIVGGESAGPAERRLVEPCIHRVEFGHLTEWGCQNCNGTNWAPKPEALEWVRPLRDQCVAADVPFFFKQFGGPHPTSAGDLLDGRQWHQFPEVAHAL